MNDQRIPNGLFDESKEAYMGDQMRAHFCAKCGTGYATDECEKPVHKVGPSEAQETEQALNERIIADLLGCVIGERPGREGLIETPKRVVKAWKAWTAGYHQDPAEILKSFEDGAEGTSGQWVIVKDIPIYSHCEHHLAPFFGTATIGYIPNGRVVGLSKLSRLADVYARRLQVQERMTNQIADALFTNTGAQATMVIVNCRHMCMESRGVQRSGASTITQAFRHKEWGMGTSVKVDQMRADFYNQLKAI